MAYHVLDLIGLYIRHYMFTSLKKPVSDTIVVMLALLLMNYCMPYNVTVTWEHNFTRTEAMVYDGASVNEIESVFELITEEWMDIEDCVPEQDTDDAPEDVSKVKTFYTIEVIYSNIPEIFYSAVRRFLNRNTPFIIGFSLNKPTPPPDVV